MQNRNERALEQLDRIEPPAMQNMCREWVPIPQHSSPSIATQHLRICRLGRAQRPAVQPRQPRALHQLVRIPHQRRHLQGQALGCFGVGMGPNGALGCKLLHQLVGVPISAATCGGGHSVARALSRVFNGLFGYWLWHQLVGNLHQRRHLQGGQGFFLIWV